MNESVILALMTCYSGDGVKIREDVAGDQKGGGVQYYAGMEVSVLSTVEARSIGRGSGE